MKTTVETKIVIITPPKDDTRFTLSGGKGGALIRALKQHEKSVPGKATVVLASSADDIQQFAKRIATHFSVSVEPCECLLDGTRDGFDCVSDYIDHRFATVVIIASKKMAEELAGVLVEQVGRQYRKTHSLDMDDIWMYVI